MSSTWGENVMFYHAQDFMIRFFSDRSARRQTFVKNRTKDTRRVLFLNERSTWRVISFYFHDPGDRTKRKQNTKSIFFLSATKQRVIKVIRDYATRNWSPKCTYILRCYYVSSSHEIHFDQSKEFRNLFWIWVNTTCSCLENKINFYQYK